MNNWHSIILALIGLLVVPAVQAQRSIGPLRQKADHVRTAIAHPHTRVLRGGGPPANDECANAAPLTLALFGDCASSQVSGDNGASTISTGDPSCDNSIGGYQDVWYTLNSGDNTTIYITLTPGTIVDLAFTVATDCTFGNEVACSIGISNATAVSVDPQTLYYVRVYSNLDYGAGGTFTLCASNVGVDPPANDLCGSAVAEALEPGSPLSFTGTTVGATLDGDIVAGSYLEGAPPAVWHAFTITTCGTITVNYCGTDPIYSNVAGYITHDCPTGDYFILPSDDVDCGDGNLLLTYNNVPPGTYNLPVWSYPPFAYGPYTITVSMEACPEGYCIPSSVPTDGDYIAGVLLGEINNITLADTNYVDYTSLSTDLGQGEEYTLSITGGDYAPDAYAAWIDYNNDTLFTADEKLGQISTGFASGEVVAITFTVPMDAPLGMARMRVRCAYNSPPIDACTDYAYGETEDYSVNIVMSIGVADNHKADFAVMPNPSNGNFQISAVNSGNTKIQLLDLTGRVVYAEQVVLNAGALHTIALEGKLASGTYSLRLSTTEGSTTRMVVVK